MNFSELVASREQPDVHNMCTDFARFGPMAAGSVFRRSGGWAFRVDAGFHPETGKRRQVLRQGFPTKKAAQLALNNLASASARGQVVARSTITVKDYLAEWLVTTRSKRITATPCPSIESSLTSAGTNCIHHAGRSRGRLLPSHHHGHRSRHPITTAVTRPDALQSGPLQPTTLSRGPSNHAANTEPRTLPVRRRRSVRALWRVLDRGCGRVDDPGREHLRRHVRRRAHQGCATCSAGRRWTTSRPALSVFGAPVAIECQLVETLRRGESTGVACEGSPARGVARWAADTISRGGDVMGNATIVFTDLASRPGCGQFLVRRPPTSCDAIRLGNFMWDESAHDAVLTRVVVAHRGPLIRSAGDGVLATMESASDGVAAAVAMQQAVHELGRRRRWGSGCESG
jgi:hypothetical protein